MVVMRGLVAQGLEADQSLGAAESSENSPTVTKLGVHTSSATAAWLLNG